MRKFLNLKDRPSFSKLHLSQVCTSLLHLLVQWSSFYSLLTILHYKTFAISCEKKGWVVRWDFIIVLLWNVYVWEIVCTMSMQEPIKNKQLLEMSFNSSINGAEKMKTFSPCRFFLRGYSKLRAHVLLWATHNPEELVAGLLPYQRRRPR